MPQKTYETMIEYGNTDDWQTSTSWVALAAVESITPPPLECDDITTTHLETDDEHNTYIPGLADGGEVEAVVQYDAEDNETLFGFFRVKKAWRVRFTGGSGWKWNGYIKKIADDEVVNGDIVRTGITIKVTGRPVMDATIATS